MRGMLVYIAKFYQRSVIPVQGLIRQNKDIRLSATNVKFQSLTNDILNQ